MQRRRKRIPLSIIREENRTNAQCRREKMSDAERREENQRNTQCRRDSMTEESAAQQRIQNREAHQRSRRHLDMEACLTVDEMITRFSEGDFGPPVTEERTNEIVSAIRNKITTSGLLEYPCLVCDELQVRKDGVFLTSQDLVATRRQFMSRAQTLLKATGVTPSLPRLLISLYNVIPACLEFGWTRKEANLFKSLLLSPRAIISRSVFVCSSCYHSVRCNHLPKFAIANNNTIGWLPTFWLE